MGALKSITFHILSSFRGLIIILLKLIKLIAILFSAVMIFVNLFQDKANKHWWIVVVWILIFILSSVFMHYYDVLILKLKPDDLDITLYK